MALVSFEEAARQTGLSPWTLRHWAAGRRFETVKLGRRRLIPEEALARLIAGGTIAPDPRVALPGAMAGGSEDGPRRPTGTGIGQATGGNGLGASRR